jgi:hypothetical protein
MTIDISSLFEIAGSAAAGAVSAITAMYKLFVPRGEAREYRRGVDQQNALILNRILSVETSLSKEVKDHRESVEEHRAFLFKRLDNVEFALSKAITRETLDDVMGPLKDDLREIKQLLRGRL